MAASNIDKSIEIGFAEFAATLISETLSAIITTTLTQERQVAQLEQQILLSPEEYAKENLTKELVEAEISQLFPPITKGKKSSVEIGEPYSINDKTGESPSINKKIGYTITDKDLDGTKNNISQQKISKVGYDNIYEATKLALATQQLGLIKQMVMRGIPRVYVNDGHIKTKLLLRLGDQTPAESTLKEEEKKIGLFDKLRRRVIVQPVNATKPEILTLKADILSEIEITFKVVIP